MPARRAQSDRRSSRLMNRSPPRRHAGGLACARAAYLLTALAWISLASAFVCTAAIVVRGARQRGAGRALGGVISEWVLFVTGATIAGVALWPEYIADFALAFAFGIAYCDLPHSR
jgi:hypothetical protein